MNCKLLFVFFSLLLAACGSSDTPKETTDIETPPIVEDGKVAQIVINEAASQNSIIDDIDGDSPDWIELYNGTDAAIELTNWALTDDAESPAKWLFPNVTIAANSYLMVWASDKNSQILGQYRSFITTEHPAQYVTPTDQLSTSWVSTDYDDSSWISGKSGIGYGDNDDNSIIEVGVRSVFARFKFTLDNIELIDQLILDMDYDDAFVAYLNGQEIARNNIGGLHPAFDAHANASHEALIYAGGSPERFDVSAFLDVLIDGENVLAIQVHNHGDASSDMTLQPFLTGHIVNSELTNIGTAPADLLNFSNDELHTNFKLSNDTPETVYLLDDNGALIHSLFVAQHALNGSTGLSQDGEVVQFIHATPNRINSLEHFAGVVKTVPEFSHDGGSTDAISVTLSGQTENQQIRYTTDATVPTVLSSLYSGAISVTTNTVLRATIFEADFIPSATETRSFLIDQQHDLPVISLVTEPENLWNHHSGMYVSGPSANSVFPFFNSNFWQDWEKPMHFSLYDSNTSLILEMDLGAKIFGGWSRANEQRSFSLFARGRYGKSKIKGPVFDQLDYQEFQTLVMRNSGQDWMKTMFKDVATTTLMAGSGLDYQAARPSVAYLNGEYWGIYNLREKVNEHFLASKHDLDPEQIDIVEADGVLVEGDNRDFNNLMEFVEDADLSTLQDYQYVASKIDMENFIRYQVAQIYFDNHDWPGNNIKMWRPKNGKWRWILYDTDFSFNNFPDWHEEHSFDSLTFATTPHGNDWPNPPWSTLLLRSLLDNQDFKIQFINQFADDMNSRFESSRVYQHVANQAAVIGTEIPEHFNRWNGNSNTQLWQSEVAIMQQFGLMRPGYMKTHILNYFELASTYQLTLNQELSAAHVSLNSLVISDPNWQGEYFSSIPIQLEFIEQNGVVFSHWLVNGERVDERVLHLEPTADITIDAIIVGS